MNDRYLYRAKRTDNGEWAIWNMLNGIPHDTIIYEETICQCTGMPDNNGTVAYEKDILKTPVGYAKIVWSNTTESGEHHIDVGFKVVFIESFANDQYRHDLGYWIGKSEIVGNIYDNPELLEIGEEVED